jgi:hypothetical protein
VLFGEFDGEGGISMMNTFNCYIAII